MRKEYTKFTREVFNENMESTGEIEEVTILSLIPDTGKLIKQISTGIVGTKVEIGNGDSEENYEEVDDPNYTEVIDAIVDEVSNGL